MAVKRRTVFSTGDIAKMVGVSTMTVRRWVNDDDLNYIELPGGSAQIYRQDLIEFFAKRDLDLADVEDRYYTALDLAKEQKNLDESSVCEPDHPCDDEYEDSEDYVEEYEPE